ncbi:NAD(P)/FAD-dependent oxidoreductase [Arthrobacter sp. NIO-1057]|uniref:NAD(P)/FAD-dependent oxidoreductase n=1 Tax=Arthrobacter sp. NIO-1057 TaxID=993071 RepID=UPI00071C46D7|nr:FAD-binding oxidoreductase [Arthrobacter sp. NIO-1057]KSU66822.1 FAD-dependent oxidoreductase [Arthrobacter sp. NIO-1057]SCC18540.1 Glycine/D-amino acid oxidase [Arthrobacter sp. NIO-1057]
MLNGQVSHWWEQIGVPESRPELRGHSTVDVAIIGAGFTGLWTAYYLAKAKPGLNIAVLEARHVGYGASGRNGGWLTNTITAGPDHYRTTHSIQEINDFQLAMNQTVEEVINICAEENIDADILRGGEFEVAYTPAQEQRLREHARATSSWQHTDSKILEAEEARNKINVAGTRVALWHPHAARIHPAKLVRGLAEAAERLGVKIFENTRVKMIRPRQLEFDGGTVNTQFIVRATEGFTAQLAGHHRLWLPMNSSMIVTEPLAESVWDELNWSAGEVLGDYAHVYMYAQRTADDRIAIGGRGVPYKYGSRTDLDGLTPQSTVTGLSEVLHRMFPQTQHAKIAHAWSGVLGVPRDWAATVGLDPDTGIGWAGGYVGTGVATTNLSGRTLRDLILGHDTALTQLPWVNHRVRKWEPEPLRWLATKGLYAAYSQADRSELKGREGSSPLARIADKITGKP